ncbi:MAG: DUF2442 domain-containing protein [Chloroflexi bacterium]|nr:DUF2442 domain-containing protein [Chloroflexota bacterium]MBI4506286.1 DUF2442 domain-containing protein [Chloroflexota bacterium]
MSISELRSGERIKGVRIAADALSVDLYDGRTITVPLAWYPRLLRATPEQRANWRICGGGYGIHWPEIDEDLSTEGLLRGAPAPRRSASSKTARAGRHSSSTAPQG